MTIILNKSEKLLCLCFFSCYLLCLLGTFLQALCELADLILGFGGVSLGMCFTGQCCALFLPGLVITLFGRLHLQQRRYLHNHIYSLRNILLSTNTILFKHCLKGQLTQKLRFCHPSFIIMLHQTCMVVKLFY